MDNLIESSRRWATECPQKVAYIFLDGKLEEARRVTFAQVDERARAIAASLRAKYEQGERVLLVFDHGPGFVEAFLGCVYGGLIPVPTVPPRRHASARERLGVVVKDAEAQCVLTERSVLGRVKLEELGDGVAALDVRDVAGFDVEAAADWQKPEVNADTPLFFQYTSGSTSTPKGVVVTHGNITNNEQLIHETFESTTDDVFVGWLPLFHDMGLIGLLLHPLFMGAQCVLMSPATFVTCPVNWLRAVSKYRGTISGGPNFSYQVCFDRIGDEQLEGIDLSTWRVAFNGAEPVRASTLRQFGQRFAAHGFDDRAFAPCYGLAEATLIVTGKPGGLPPVIETFGKAGLQEAKIEAPRDEADAMPLVSSGRVRSEAEVVIVDPQTLRAMEDGHVGEIWVRGDSVAPGYWKKPEATAQIFEAELSDAPGARFLRTGDLGVLREGELFVTGRVKELIIVRGRNYAPSDIEACVRATNPAFGVGVAFGLSDGEGEERLIVVQELERHRDPKATPQALLETARVALAKEQGIHLHDLLVTKSRTVPRTTSGKLRRLKTRELYLREAFDTRESTANTKAADGAPEHDDGELITRLGRMLHEHFEVRVTSPDTALRDVGLDSLASLQFVGLLRDEYALSVEPETLDELSLRVLARRIRGERSVDAAATRVDEAGVDTSRASATEAHFLHLHEVSRGSSALNVWVAFETDRAVDEARMKVALGQLAEHHPLLVANYRVEGEPRRVSGRPSIPVEVLSCPRGSDARTTVRRALQRSIDPQRDPLLRVVLVRTGAERTMLAVVAHHVVVDLIGLSRFVELLLSTYDGGLVAGAEDGYGGHATACARQQAHHESAAGRAGRDYWMSKLKTLAVPSNNRALDAEVPRKAATMRADLGDAFTSAVRAIAREHQCTPYVASLAAFVLAMRRQAGRDEFLVVSPFAARSDAAAMKVVNASVNPAWLSSGLRSGQSVGELVEALRTEVAECLRHQGTHVFTALAEQGANTALGSRALSRFSFAFQSNYRTDGLGAMICGGDGESAQVGSWELRNVPIERDEVMSHLEFFVHLTEGQARVRVDYAQGSFSTKAVEGMLEDLSDAATIAASDAKQSVQRLLETISLRRAQVERQPSPAIDGDPLRTALLDTLASRGDDVAVEACDGSWTYAQLDEARLRIATCLARHGITAGTRVAVMLRRDRMLVPLLLGLWTVGAHHVPLDAGQPCAWNAGILRRSSCDEVLVSGAYAARAEFEGRDPIAADALFEASGEVEMASTSEVDARSLAYVLFTSGSTGVPKGVCVDRRSVANFFAQLQAIPSFASSRRVVALTTIAFDIAVTELFFPLSIGARVQLVSDVEVADPRQLSAAIDGFAPDLLQTTPSRLAQLLDAGLVLSTSTRVIACGEALGRDVVQRMPPQLELWNMYGPTEATVLASGVRVDHGGEITVGTALKGTRLYVLDERGVPVAQGVRGELCISGPCLAQGYHAMPAATAAHFVPDPFSGVAGDRMYRTRDIVSRNPDGELHYHGRSDGQVKLRGHRIELREVEIAIENVPGVSRALVRVEGEQKDALAAYVEVSDPHVLERLHESIVDTLFRQLPTYMVPERIERVEGFAVGPTGKLDREAELVSTALPRRSANTRPPTPTEGALCEVWRAALQHDAIGIDENFFALGGTSLVAARISTAITEAFGVQVSPRTLYELPTVARLAEFIDLTHQAASTTKRNDAGTLLEF